MQSGVLLTWNVEVGERARWVFSEFWTVTPWITPWIMSLGMVAGLWWFFGRKDR
jgi:hypothetical protein